jgi:hypothetical protein
MSGFTGAEARWRRSSRCHSGHCVEVARFADGSVGMRDSTRPDGGRLTFAADTWARFLTEVRGGTTRS